MPLAMETAKALPPLPPLLKGRRSALPATLWLRHYSPADLSWSPRLSKNHGEASIELHVWCAGWAELRARGAQWNSYLASDEQTRAGRFLRAQDAERYRLGRGWLRRLLGHYLNARPELLRLKYGRHGKPYVLESGVPSSLHFNVAHSGALLLVALGRHRALGVDLEKQRANVDCNALVQRFFSCRERTAFFALPAQLRGEAFFRAWTCKEACLKALGTGLAAALNAFEIALAPQAAPRLRAGSTEEDASGRWLLHSWTPRSGYAAALAMVRSF